MQGRPVGRPIGRTLESHAGGQTGEDSMSRRGLAFALAITAFFGPASANALEDSTHSVALYGFFIFLDGDLTFAIAGARTTEPVHAAMTPNGHLVAEIGSDASLELHIVDPGTLDYCFSRYGTDFVYRCGTLVRGD